MNHEVGCTDFPESSNASMYPDPDDMPTYPWLGASTFEVLSRSQEHLTGPARWSRMPSLSSRDDHETELNDEERMPVGKDPNDPLVDPDFQYFDEGAV